MGDGRNEYAYNTDNTLATEVILDYTGGDYDSLYKRNYNYTEGKLTNYINQYYAAGWENDNIFIYTYNSDGLAETLTGQYWSGASWVNSVRFLYTYDEDNNLVDEVVQSYSPGWETDGRYVYTYNASGFMTEAKTQNYDGVDYNDAQKSSFVEFMDGVPASNTRAYWDGFVWVTDLRIRFKYESYDDGTVGIEDVEDDSDFAIYPNPATDNLTIEFNSASGSLVSIIITNTAGEIVNTQNFKAVPGKNKITKSLDTGLPAGIYNLTIRHDGIREVKSFVKL